MKQLLYLFQVSLALFFVSVESGQAATITWGSQFNDVLLNSDGQNLDATFSFEIGTFEALIPTASNMGEWAAAWKVFDRAYQDDANGWNWVERFFTGNAIHQADGSSSSVHAQSGQVFQAGEVVYLWVYNSKNIESGTEWALVSNGLAGGSTFDDWIMPDPLESVSTTYEWALVDANEVVVGGANGMRGAGEFSATPANFSIQTAAVPEPGSMLLLAGAALARVLRRRRS